MRTSLKTGSETETQAAAVRGAAVWLETPVLRFIDVLEDRSKVQAIVFRGVGYDRLEMVVVSPPLAPFSVTRSPHSPFGGLRRADDRGLDEVTAELWIRYDATSSMASDLGQITVAHACSGRQWTVELDGSAPLAKPAS